MRPDPEKTRYPDQVTYDTYIAWRRLTHNGKRGRDEMSAREQEEYDALEVSQAPGPDPEEARRAYEEVTGRSGPGSASPT